jgi:hypothetical protein
MTDGAARFAARYPIVWHVIEAEGAGPWLSITGLLPAAASRRLAGLAADDRNRDEFQRLDLGDGRVAVLRPQLMADDRLTPTLSDRFAGRPGAWRAHINAHVFFWTEPSRRDAFIRACVRERARSKVAPADALPLILRIDTAALLSRHGGAAYFARINTGSTVRGGARARRDETTLAPMAGYRAGPAAELAIRGCVQPGGLSLRAGMRDNG